MDISIPIGEFKTHCYQLLEKAKAENNRLTITKRGQPFVQVIPVSNQKEKQSLFDSLKEWASINGDIIEPIDISWNARDE